jgi:hypothetical protein
MICFNPASILIGMMPDAIEMAWQDGVVTMRISTDKRDG